MKARPRWQRCISHHDDEVVEFFERYLQAEDRVCLLVAGAGFDPRSTSVARLLSSAYAGGGEHRLRALFLRERRPNPDAGLVARGDAHALALRTLVSRSEVIDVEVLSPEDGAVVGGQRAIQALSSAAVAELEGVTDVILDMSALSIGISFPVAKYLYETCVEAGSEVNFHVVVASNPMLDASISSVPSDVVDPVRGFSGGIDLAASDEDAKIWLPHLAAGRSSVLQLIRENLKGPVDICPVLPLSERDPRAADKLIAAFEIELDRGWEVDPRNIVYAVENDPLDLYRTITAIHRRHTEVFAQVTPAHVVLSPSGNKVLAIGALMAALENDLPVRYVETVSYSADWTGVALANPDASRFVHVWLHGIPYAEPAPSMARKA
jgi:hypothetical protein